MELNYHANQSISAQARLLMRERRQKAQVRSQPMLNRAASEVGIIV